MVEVDGELKCLPGDMPLSQSVRQALTEVCINDHPAVDDLPRTIRWGGMWFCPEDGSEMIENEGMVRCEVCEKRIPGRILYQLIELHPHRAVQTS
jgi:hypothetical protein